MPGGIFNPESLQEIIGFCGSFLTLQDQTVYFIHQSAKDFLLGKALGKTFKASQDAFNWVFPSGTEDVNYTIFSRSLNAMSTVLQRDMYRLREPAFPIENVQVPVPDPLVTVRYSCVYWVDHLRSSISGTRTTQECLQDGGVVHTFLEKKYLYWLEALSLLNSMSKGVMAVLGLRSLVVSSNDAIASKR